VAQAIAETGIPNDGTADGLLQAYAWDVTSYSYDNLGRVCQTEVESPNAATQTTDTLYDGDNNPSFSIVFDTADDISEVDVVGRVTSNVYDAYNRLASTTVSVNTGYKGAAKAATTKYTYYANGETASMTPPLTTATTYTYDDFGNALTTTLPTSAVTASVYDGGFGDLLQVTDANHNVTQYGYDGVGNQISNTIYSTGLTTGTAIPWTYQYDAFGDQIYSQDRDKNIVTTTYDSVGRKTGQSTAGYSSSYTYNALSEPLSASDDNSSYTYKYDPEQYNLQSQEVSYTVSVRDKHYCGPG
jgi:YD repeat-containing protein